MRVIYEHDGKWWVATATDLQGCHTQGRTIAQARKRIREAIQACKGLKKPYAKAIDEDIRLPAKSAKELATYKEMVEHVTLIADAAGTQLKKTVHNILDQGISMRDAGELMGLSHQRVHQVSKAG